MHIGLPARSFSTRQRRDVTDGAGGSAGQAAKVKEKNLIRLEEESNNNKKYGRARRVRVCRHAPPCLPIYLSVPPCATATPGREVEGGKKRGKRGVAAGNQVRRAAARRDLRNTLDLRRSLANQ